MKKILLASALLLGVSFTSCNSYLDINTDPNSPAEEKHRDIYVDACHRDEYGFQLW